MSTWESMSQRRMYFGYGSNMWKEQMSLRCPSSYFLGVGRLPKCRWIINDRGYANVVDSEGMGQEVYGLVYSLEPSDERSLDRNEGVPFAYTKETMSVDFWPSDGSSNSLDGRAKTKEEVLVYIDRERVENNAPKEEYVHRMNMGVRDGVREGIPQDYIDKSLRTFIPSEGKAEVEGLAREQASKFEDET